MKKPTKCSGCELPGGYTGSVYLMQTRVPQVKGKSRFLLKKEARPMCLNHYMENQFGLWPYRCTVACSRAREKASELKLRPERLVIWLGMEVILGKGNHPNCPWCSKPLRPQSALHPQRVTVRRSATPSLKIDMADKFESLALAREVANESLSDLESAILKVRIQPRKRLSDSQKR